MLLSLLSMVALGSPYEEEVAGDLGTLDPDTFDELLEEASGRAPEGTTSVRLFGRRSDGSRVNLVDTFPVAAVTPRKEGGYRGLPVDHVGQEEGFLSGRATYLSQCHGWVWYDSLGRFSTQRGNVWDTVEDFHNPEAMNQVLSAYLENAGAEVHMVKERDLNPLWGIADNDADGYAETGSGFETHDRGFRLLSHYDYGDNPMASGTSRRFPANGGGVATWAPVVPEDGYYAVYVTWQSASDNSPSAHYRITHNGGVIDRWFDQRVHGSNWRFLENLWLEAGTESLKIELIGDSQDAGWLSADTVRVGGGTGIVRRNGETTGRPRWEEGAILGAQFNGAPSSIYDPWGDGDGSDPSARSKWAAWEHPSGEDAIYLSWHSNAVSSGTARGTVTYYAGNECSNPPVTGSGDLAQLVQDELITQFDPHWEDDWYDRGVRTACFSEVSPTLNPEMPAALVELAFHDNETDAWFLRHPLFRIHSARGMYRGIVRYFAERDGVSPVFLPEPPTHVSAVQDADGIRVRWAPGPTGAPNGDAATSYRVFTSTDGRSWDNGVDVDGTELVVDVNAGDSVFIRVAGLNSGGISFPSAVVGARRSPDGKAPVLVVDAFDRLDGGLLHYVAPGSSLGEIVRMNLRMTNSYDTVVSHGRAVDAHGWPFDAALDEALPALENYRVVVWATGEESTADQTFSDSQQAAIAAFVSEGGQLVVSGAEIFWDLSQRGEEDFAREVLGATLERDAAGSTNVDGEGLLEGVGPMDFGLEDGAPYPVEYPDTLDSDATVIARYQSGEVAGVLGPYGAVFGFPFETIGDPAVQQEVMARLLGALAPDYTPPVGGESEVSNGGRQPLDQLGCGCRQGAAGTGNMLFGLLLMLVVRRSRAL